MPSAKSLVREPNRVRRRPLRRAEPGQSGNKALRRNWRSEFLATLAETSNVRRSCEVAGVNPSMVYDLRRRDTGFAQRWVDALCEGYANLEMEMLHQLRSGERGGDGPRFNYAVALRMLLAHRETVNREKARRVDVDVAKVRASIALRFERMREILTREAREACGIAQDGPAHDERAHDERAQDERA